jgi:hypothetical protein
MSAQLATLSGNGARLRQGLGALARARWLSEMAVWLTRGLAAGLLGAVVVLLAARFVNVPPWLPIAAILAGLLVGAIVAATRPQSLRRTALLADRRLDFRERLTTAWEIHQRGLDSPLAAAQLADTTARLRGVRPFRAFPVRLPRTESGAAVVLLVLAVALWLAPNPHRLDQQRQLAERSLIAQQAQAVGQLAQQIQTTAGSQPSPEQANTIQALKQLQAQMQDSKVTTADALSELAAAEDRLRAQDGSAAGAAKDSLDKAAAALAAGQGGDSPTNGLGQSIGQGQYAQAASQLQQLAKDAPQMTQAQRDALQSTLNGAGAAAAKSDPALGQALQQAANSLGSAAQPGNPASEQQAFNQAASALQQAGQAVTGDNQAQQAVSQVQASEAALSAAQQAAGQNATGQASTPGDQAQQVSSLGNPTAGQQATGSQLGTPSDSSTAGQPSDGSASGSQAGASGDSSGQAAGTEAAGQGQQAGQAAGQSGQGANGQNGDGSGQGQAGGHGSGGGPGSQVYAPQPVNGHTEQLPNSATDPGQQVAANGSQAPQNNQSLVPYNQVIGNYQQQAAQAMDQSQVPLDKKNLVRDYFSALASGK